MTASGTITIEADHDLDALLKKLQIFEAHPERSNWDILVLSEREEFPAVSAVVSEHFPGMNALDIGSFADPAIASMVLAASQGDRIAFIPAELEPCVPPFADVDEDRLIPLVADVPYPEWNFEEHQWICRGWLVHRRTIARPVERGHLFGWDLLSIAHANEDRSLQWLSASPSHPPLPEPAKGTPVLTGASRIMALITHFGCEDTLAQAIDSMVNQSRPPDAIVVIDDASENPPTAIVAGFPGVTLARSLENVGLFRLINQAVADTDYDGYMIQDADDWSANDRLALLLTEAERSGAETVGTQQLQIVDPVDLTEAQIERMPHGLILPVNFPLDPNHALAHNPCHCQSAFLLSRALWSRLGGYSTAWRFGMDTELQWRAAHTARMVNIPNYSYYRRLRPGSLTTDPQTGLGSPARQEMRRTLEERYAANRNASKPDLTPLATAPPIELVHVTGPRVLRSHS
ncbi:MAG: glycosyltransferase family 2 protein [Acidobacteriota bacterium]|nr:glycosyltransferase family 2 protein [Acidobacteriota bacterium]